MNSVVILRSIDVYTNTHVHAKTMSGKGGHEFEGGRGMWELAGRNGKGEM